MLVSEEGVSLGSLIREFILDVMDTKGLLFYSASGYYGLNPLGGGNDKIWTITAAKTNE